MQYYFTYLDYTYLDMVNKELERVLLEDCILRVKEQLVLTRKKLINKLNYNQINALKRNQVVNNVRDYFKEINKSNNT